ncbi:MAG TPA: hypothetical protein VJX67_18770 [Blastocatellia bacterium]|nr:hypothetical protein [Blastocatellia bacterium]
MGIGEYFLIQELQRSFFHVGANLGKKQIKKFQEESRDQFFEQSVVVDHNNSTYTIARRLIPLPGAFVAPPTMLCGVPLSRLPLASFNSNRYHYSLAAIWA